MGPAPGCRSRRPPHRLLLNAPRLVVGRRAPRGRDGALGGGEPRAIASSFRAPRARRRSFVLAPDPLCRHAGGPRVSSAVSIGPGDLLPPSSAILTRAFGCGPRAPLYPLRLRPKTGGWRRVCGLGDGRPCWVPRVGDPMLQWAPQQLRRAPPSAPPPRSPAGEAGTRPRAFHVPGVARTKLRARLRARPRSAGPRPGRETRAAAATWRSSRGWRRPARGPRRSQARGGRGLPEAGALPTRTRGADRGEERVDGGAGRSPVTDAGARSLCVRF